MKKPIIGIVLRPSKTIYNKDSYIATDSIRKIVANSGGIPIGIMPPNDLIYTLDYYPNQKLTKTMKNDLTRVINMCDGIIFQGGSRWYSYDEFIASYVIENDIPSLGICLGMQLLAYIDSLKKPPLNNTFYSHNQGDIKYVHGINIFFKTPLYDILQKEKISVNSSHQHQVITLNNFQVMAKSFDGVVEAIYYPGKKYIIGYQFHPETMSLYDENARKIFKHFINSLKK